MLGLKKDATVSLNAVAVVLGQSRNISLRLTFPPTQRAVIDAVMHRPPGRP